VTRDEDPYANDENLAAMGLGGMVHGFTNLELTSAYNSIANDGTYVEPVSFSKIEDTRGNLILDNQPERTEVVSPQTAFIMKDILRNLTDASVIQTVKIDGIDTAGKTGTSGTTTRNIDSWFVGFTPYLTAGVWIGSDDPNNVFIDEVSSYAVRFWGIVMRSMHEGYEDKTFDIPEGIVEAQVCTQSGKKPTSLCYADPRGTVRTEYFVRGTEPVEECDAHVSARVDRSTNRLATQFCPENLVVNRVFVKRPKPYVPSENEGILPDDWAYTLPTTYCHVHTQPAQTEPPETEPAETEETTEPDTDTPQTDPPQTEPPQTDPPQTDPPQTDPPADGDE
jgi:penicillin-binding protein 1A